MKNGIILLLVGLFFIFCAPIRAVRKWIEARNRDEHEDNAI